MIVAEIWYGSSHKVIETCTDIELDEYAKLCILHYGYDREPRRVKFNKYNWYSSIKELQLIVEDDEEDIEHVIDAEVLGV